MKNWFHVVAAAAAGARAQVTIYDEIGGWGINAKEYLRQWKAIDAAEVDLFINSPGGSVFDAVAMFNGMKASGKTIHVTVLGIAASAASYVALVGDTITMPENTYMMVHNPLSGVYGNADDMRDMADVLDKVGASLRQTYLKRSGMAEAKLTELFSKDSYLTAQECVDLGLCDKVTAAIKAVARFELDRQGIPENVLAMFKAGAEPANPNPANPAQPEAPLVDRVAALVKTAGLEAYQATFALDPAIVDMSTAQAAIDRARQVVSLCALAGLPDEAAGFITARKDLAAVRDELTQELAARDESRHVSNFRSSRNDGGGNSTTSNDFNPMALWEKTIRPMEAAARKA